MAIAHGLAEARKLTIHNPPQGPVGASFKTHLEAEEWSAWTVYRREQREAKQRLSLKRPNFAK